MLHKLLLLERGPEKKTVGGKRGKKSGWVGTMTDLKSPYLAHEVYAARTLILPTLTKLKVTCIPTEHGKLQINF